MLLLSLLIPGDLRAEPQAQPPSGGRGPAAAGGSRAGNVSPPVQGAPASALTRLLDWLGFGPPKVINATRGLGRGVPSPGAIWLMNSDGSGAHPLTQSGGYSSPVFLPDGSGIVAIHRGGLVVVKEPATAAAREIKLAQDIKPLWLLAFSKSAPEQLGLIDGAGRVVAVHTGTGALVNVTEGVAPLALTTLFAATRTCGGRVVYDAEQIRSTGGTRLDVFVRPSDKNLGTSLTERSSRGTHAQPSFSPDCKKIAFVSEEGSPPMLGAGGTR